MNRVGDGSSSDKRDLTRSRKIVRKRIRWVRINLVTSLHVENNMRALQFFDSNAITTAAEKMHFALTAAHYVISLFMWQKRHDQL